MKFVARGKRLVSLKSIQSKKSDWSGTFVRIADKGTYENLELVLAEGARADELEVGRDYDITLDFDGRQASVALSAARPAAAGAADKE
jgi:hypothetical protein